MAKESAVDVAKSNGEVTYPEPIGKWGDKSILQEQREAGWPAFREWQPTWFDVGPVKFAAFGDRLLVEEDEFRSGYECQACKGSGKRDCTSCGGSGHYKRGEREFKCATCEGRGTIVCIECGGKGGLIVVPEVSQRRPSTGKVVSTGDKVVNFHAGDNVLYSNFAGHTVDLERAGFKVVLRILHETEILAQVKGHLELRQLRNEREALGI